MRGSPTELLAHVGKKRLMFPAIFPHFIYYWLHLVNVSQTPKKKYCRKLVFVRRLATPHKTTTYTEDCHSFLLIKRSFECQKMIQL